jgi:MFS transporter, PAT family, beta-lactamase induction signal transducer AmpG
VKTSEITNKKSPWLWVPSLYFAEGIPYAVVMYISVIMYKNLGLSNAEVALYTSWLYLPWVIKPFWSPFVDLYKTKRIWIIFNQILLGAGFAAIAFSLHTSRSVQYSLAFFWLLAFSSATHDIAADGFYMLGLDTHNQAFFVGIRSMFYRFAMILGQGILVMLVGYLQTHAISVFSIGSEQSVQSAWIIIFIILGLLYIAFAIYHTVSLPKPEQDKNKTVAPSDLLKEFLQTFALFFKKKHIILTISFLLIYRLGEAQLLKLAAPFFLDAKNAGGLGLTTVQVGFVYGTVGVIALTIGGFLGGFVAAKDGLKKWIWWMFLAINIPHFLYIILAFVQPDSFFVINGCVALEQFGYGFGFSAYMMYMLYISDGEYKTAHYAIATGFMALSMMLPGLVSGYIQQFLGYKLFFIWILITMIPGYFIVRMLPVDVNFGKKKIDNN